MSLQPRDSHVTDPAEIRRLTSQSARILAALQERPRTARELSEISLKYTSRVSDLRKAGYDIRCEERSLGLTIYRLVGGQADPLVTQGHNTNASSPGSLF